MIEILNVEDLSGWKERETKRLKKQLAEMLEDAKDGIYLFSILRPYKAAFEKCKSAEEIVELAGKLLSKTFTDEEVKKYNIRLSKHYIISEPYRLPPASKKTAHFLVIVRKASKEDREHE